MWSVQKCVNGIVQIQVQRSVFLAQVDVPCGALASAGRVCAQKDRLFLVCLRVKLLSFWSLFRCEIMLQCASRFFSSKGLFTPKATCVEVGCLAQQKIVPAMVDCHTLHGNCGSAVSKAWAAPCCSHPMWRGVVQAKGWGLQYTYILHLCNTWSLGVKKNQLFFRKGHNTIHTKRG